MEHVPFDHFLSWENFASSISPWVVTLDALEPFRTNGPIENPNPLPYLHFIEIKYRYQSREVILKLPTVQKIPFVNPITKHVLNMEQQLAHHTSNGCNINCGDKDGLGNPFRATLRFVWLDVELTWKGTKPLKLKRRKRT